MLYVQFEWKNGRFNWMSGKWQDRKAIERHRVDAVPSWGRVYILVKRAKKSPLRLLAKGSREPLDIST